AATLAGARGRRERQGHEREACHGADHRVHVVLPSRCAPYGADRMIGSRSWTRPACRRLNRMPAAGAPPAPAARPAAGRAMLGRMGTSISLWIERRDSRGWQLVPRQEGRKREWERRDEAERRRAAEQLRRQPPSPARDLRLRACEVRHQWWMGKNYNL